MERWDLVIIGAGAAGLAAGIYGVRSGLKTLIIDEKIAGGTTADAPLVENYLGYSRIAGAELADKMTLQCRNAGATIHELETVEGLDLASENNVISTNQAVYNATSVILATGARYREIRVPGEREFRGKGVSYCGVCDGPLFKGKRVLVVGGGNSALTTTLYLSGIVSEVIVVHRRETFRAEEALVKDTVSRKNVKIFLNSELREIKGEKTVNKVALLDNRVGETKEFSVDGVFIQVGETPNSQLAKQSGVEVDEKGFIKIDIYQRTNLPGVYAAGDVTNHPVKQVGTAVGQGITAALEAYSFVKQPYCRK